MYPINVDNFGVIYPVKFTSPLPITECKNRLQESLGKAMGSLFTTIEGEVQIVDEITCKFRLYQDVSKGGRRSIVGYLYTQSNSSTEVDAVFGIERYPQGFLIIASVLCVVIITLMLVKQILGAIIVAIILGVIYYFERQQQTNPPRPPRKFTKEPMSQLLWWFERTLKQ